MKEWDHVCLEEKRRWSMDDVRRLCVREQYYTHGTCREYDRMLTYVAEHEYPTSDEIYSVAYDIAEHSDHEEYGVLDTAMNIYHALTNDVLVYLTTYHESILEGVKIQ